MGKIFGIDFFYLKRQGYIDIYITRMKFNLGSHHCKKDYHFKKRDGHFWHFWNIFYRRNIPYMHTLIILFTTSMLQEHVKKKFLNVEYLEFLQELVLLKICRTVFSWNYGSFQGNTAVFSKNRSCRIFTKYKSWWQFRVRDSWITNQFLDPTNQKFVKLPFFTNFFSQNLFLK